jgi:hypothetical protein
MPVKELRMPHLVSLRIASLIGLLGSALVIIGFFLPVRFVTITFPPNPPTFSADSYWSMLDQTLTGGSILGPSSLMGIGSFLLAIIIPLWSSLNRLFGEGKRILLLLSLGAAPLGFLEFLVSAQFFLAFSHWSARVIEIHTVGPGYWLMFIGFPLCIISSIAQYVLSRTRIST